MAVLELTSPGTSIAAYDSICTFYPDIVYNDRPDGKGVLDLYMPDTQDVNEPWVLMIHGGSFISGNKDFMQGPIYQSVVTDLLNSGVAVVSMNYTLTETPQDDEGITRAMSSILKGILTIKTYAADLDLAPENVVYFGVSAGGYASQIYSMAEFGDQLGLGLWETSSLPRAAVSFKPNLTMDMFKLEEYGLWGAGNDIEDVLAVSDFSDNCPAWFGVASAPTTRAQLNTEGARRIMEENCPFKLGLWSSSMKPLYMVSGNKYQDPIDLESLIHNAYNPEEIKAIYDDNSVECWIWGTDAINPVPSTPGRPVLETWIKDKLITV